MSIKGIDEAVSRHDEVVNLRRNPYAGNELARAEDDLRELVDRLTWDETHEFARRINARAPYA